MLRAILQYKDFFRSNLGKARLSMWYFAPQNVGTGTAIIYARQFWAEVVSQYTYGRPVFSQQSWLKGEFNITVPLAGSATWTE